MTNKMKSGVSVKFKKKYIIYTYIFAMNAQTVFYLQGVSKIESSGSAEIEHALGYPNLPPFYVLCCR